MWNGNGAQVLFECLRSIVWTHTYAIFTMSVRGRVSCSLHPSQKTSNP